MRRRIVLSVCLAAAVAAGPALGAAARLQVRPTTVHKGGLIHIRGKASGCAAGSTVFILSKAFPGRGSFGVGQVKARARTGGRFRARVHVRKKAHGKYSVTARCGGANLGVVAHVRVV